MLLLDVTHTSHTRARTGIQRVVRSLRTALGVQATAICHDPYLGAWRRLSAAENATLLARTGTTARRSARWPLLTQLGGRFRRQLGLSSPALPAASGLLVPEVFSPAVGRALPGLMPSIAGPRVAIFHDALPLRYPEFTPGGTVARFPAYLRELLLFDGVAAVSRASADALDGYWRWLGVHSSPPVIVLPHGLDPVPPSRRSDAGGAAVPTVLCVGSIEQRKNHGALLDACEQLWTEQLHFELRLIGLASATRSGPVLRRIRQLQSSGRAVRYDGPVDDDELERAYAGCAFTIYPSLAEGFGLPVAESLARDKPCICSGRGALGEIARGGGCVELEEVDARALATALRALLTNPPALATLIEAARQRVFRSWTDYVRELNGWMQTLPHR